jgi:mediator of RNA polymerase II transcription subunit 17
VSLLLTRHNSKQAESTISLFLKQNVPFGSIGAEVVQQTQQSASTQQTDLLVSNGWKLESLNSSADALLKSAARLEDEVRKETTYWGQVLAIEEKKWPISRLPREKHTLAVRYGFQEAAPEFRERGVAVLRRAADGSIDLDLGGGTAERAMRVLVVDLDSRVLSSSSDTITMGNDSVDIAILRARTSLFDEELFSEVFKESRLLANRGVVAENCARRKGSEQRISRWKHFESRIFGAKTS